MEMPQMDEVNLNDTIVGISARVLRGASTVVKNSWIKIFEDFKPFMEETYKRNSFVKILCKKDEDVVFDKIYVETRFSSSGNTFSDSDLLLQLNEGKNMIINGNGGSGKTFLMRFLWLSIFRGESLATPIFLELRKMNDWKSVSLESFIRFSISKNSHIDADMLSHFCENGRFYFFLDGFDEVIIAHRDELQKQILEMASIFPNCRFIVSSRFEKRFAGWSNFKIFESLPFELDQVKELIEKIPFDADSKSVFLSKLDDRFFDQNQLFLTNPLLATMMMMTFKDGMEIPSQMNIFYDQAFNTLYKWHDATKVFSRKKHLDMVRFQQVFGVFCLLSYYKEIYEFSYTEIIDFIEQSKKAVGTNISSDEILHDFEESVNLIRQDGLKYVFIHRSFQEYFSAYALIRVIPQKFKLFLERITKRTSDNVIRMRFEMNKDQVIKEYIGPKYRKYKKNGFLSNNTNDRYYYLNILRARYTIVIRNTTSKTGTESINISSNEDFTNYIDNVSRLSKDSDFDLMGITRTLLMHPRFFTVLDSTFKTPYESVQVTIYFDGTINNFIASIDFPEDQPGLAVELSSAKQKILGTLKKTNQEVGLLIKETADWCKSEIAASAKRGRSIDEIMGMD